jgi:hypothetical protein
MPLLQVLTGLEKDDILNLEDEIYKARGDSGIMDTALVTIQLPVKLYDELQSLAAEEQVALIEVLARLVTAARQRRGWLDNRPRSPTQAFQRILERATDLGVADLSEQHDHYLYGTERQ